MQCGVWGPGVAVSQMRNFGVAFSRVGSCLMLVLGTATVGLEVSALFSAPFPTCGLRTLSRYMPSHNVSALHVMSH